MYITLLSKRKENFLKSYVMFLNLYSSIDIEIRIQ